MEKDKTTQKQYIAIDLKSFYASVECAERGLDPLDANLVVADESRTDKTICLAVSPALKAYGISGRARLFEVRQAVKEINAKRRLRLKNGEFSGKSILASGLASDPTLELDFIAATPRMQYYMDYSRDIVDIYLRYVSSDDLLVYSVDEVFIDATSYLSLYKTDAHEFAMMLIKNVLAETGITATAGIGTNMYLAKIAMDIVAKHMPADKDGVRIAALDEMSYREKLWCHKPLTDFWRIGRGISKKLAANGMYTMGDVARCSLGAENDFHNEELLYKLFGINAELLIDHAWGFENTQISDCKAYKPESRSLSQGQVLSRPYSFAEARVVISEMADLLADDLVKKGLTTDQVVLDVGFDVENLTDEKGTYKGAVKADWYGRRVPHPVHGSCNLGLFTSSANRIINAVCEIYDRIVDERLMVRRMFVTVTHLLTEETAKAKAAEPKQLDLFTDYEQLEKEQKEDEKELNMQKALVNIRERYGKNSIVKGLNMREGATAIERNKQIGGHKA